MNIILTSALSGMIFMFAGFFVKGKRQLSWLAALFFVLIAVSGILQLKGFEVLAGKYPNMLVNDSYRISFFIILCLLGIYYVLMNRNKFSQPGSQVSDFLALIFLSFVGMAVLSTFNNLLLLFLGIEILSIPQYALAGSAKHKTKSTEAAVKYFLMGAFSTGVMLMGIALIYGGTGSFVMDNITAYNYDFQWIYYLGWVMLGLALCFKVAVAPMHFWGPDVYEGTPTVFSSYMITIGKGGGFLAIISTLYVFKVTTGVVADNYRYLLGFIIILTLIMGNFGALKQRSVKRMLAYSSVAQAGYMMFAFYEIGEMSKYALLYYTVSYGLANIVLFYALTKVKVSYKGFNGLSKRSPLLAMSVSVALFSLAGIPFTSGFLSKFFIISSAMQENSNLLVVIVALILAVLSVVYYFRVIIHMYFRKSNEKKIKISKWSEAFLIIGTLLTLALGTYPNLLKMLMGCFVS